MLDVFAQTYHWSIMQAEYSTDLVFKSEKILGSLYQQLAREAVLSVKAEQVATFLGKKITPQLAAEIGSRLSTRIEGTCIKHRFDSCSIKIYDKFGRILRIETTTNNVSFFKHHRKVEHRNGRATREVAPLKKSIYSLIDLREILLGCNQRYLEFLSSLDDHSDGQRRCSSGLPSPNPTAIVPSRAVRTSSTETTWPCFAPCNDRSSISMAWPAVTSCSCCPISRLRGCRANCVACACSACSSVPPTPTATTSRGPAEWPSLRSNASPPSPSFPPWLTHNAFGIVLCQIAELLTCKRLIVCSGGTSNGRAADRTACRGPRDEMP